MKLIDTKNLSREEWLKWRKKGLGGSDAAAILGLNPWKSAASVWLDKTTDDIDDIDNEKMRIGRDLEDYVAKRFEEATGKKVRRNNFMLAHDDYDFLVANVDREVVGENAVLECKTTNSYAKKDWEDDKIPLHYHLQVLHYMLVGGYDKGYIAVLIGNEKFIWKEIKRDEEEIELLKSAEIAFWQDYILGDKMPDPDGSSDYDSILKERYQRSNGQEIALTLDVDRARRLDEVKALIKTLEDEKKQIEQEIKTEMKENEKARLGDYSFTWKTIESNRLNTRALRKDLPEIADKYTNKSNYRRFTMTYEGEI